MDNKRKLLLGQKVEVRQLEEGLCGSWHPGVVVNVDDLCRLVTYDELMDHDCCKKLTELIQVTSAIEGNVQRRRTNYRGRIRPLPPQSQANSPKPCLDFGTCVDVFLQDAWWEGVVLDPGDDINNCLVYFPDEGDEHNCKLSNLRLSLEWDEFLDCWKERGIWDFVNLVKEYRGDAYLVKAVWTRLRSKSGYQKMISVWTCYTCNSWNRHVMNILMEIAVELSLQDYGIPKLQSYVGKKGSSESTTCQGYDLVSFLDHPAKPVAPYSDRLHKHQTKNSYKEEKISSFLPPEGIRSRKSGGRRKSLDECEEGNQSKTRGWSSIDTPKTRLQHISKRKAGQAEYKRSKYEFLSSRHGEKSVAFLRGSNLVQECPSVANIKPIRDRMQKRDSSRMHKDSPAVSLHKDRDITIKKRKLTLAYQLSAIRLAMRDQKLSRKRKYTDVTNQQESHRSSAKTSHFFDVENKDFGTMPGENNAFTGRHRGQPVAYSANKLTPNDKRSETQRQRLKISYFSDDQYDIVCMACHGGGELILCDHCPSTYHLTCISLQNVPDGEWFCPACRCGLCGVRNSFNDNRLFTEVCHQCSRQYHVDCLTEAGILFPRNRPSQPFCSQNCFQLCAYLHQLLGFRNATNVEGLTWTLIRSGENDCNMYEIGKADAGCCLSHVRKLLKECFLPVIEPHGQRGLVDDVIFNSVSFLKRLDFRGFYLMVLQDQNEIISAAAVRIHGQKLAEMSLVGTRFKFRRQGMFRLLILELEKMLTQLGVERLVLPATPTTEKIWETSFGFVQPSPLERLELLHYPLLIFNETKLFQKVLKRFSAAKVM
ncbi:PHD finger transcription factor-like protein [Heracleum sosnowskyi]|uniref:PHD finger transcription factor-like protein n=1 Tax=Heracleum sosnowskyi TaxID=360622 RepID=A0AAD8I7A6_9APIA|nr:PHD finger transcription factor-like protein [Heracleum sosnowskyi]